MRIFFKGETKIQDLIRSPDFGQFSSSFNELQITALLYEHFSIQIF